MEGWRVTLGCDGKVDCVAVDQDGFCSRFTVGLEDVDCLYRVLCLPFGVYGFYCQHGINRHSGKEVGVTCECQSPEQDRRANLPITFELILVLATF